MNYKEIDEEIEKFIKNEQEKGNCIACEKNCSDCCTNVPLLVTPSELDFIVIELNKLNVIQKKNISKNIKQLDKKYTSMPEHINSIENMQNSRAININVHFYLEALVWSIVLDQYCVELTCLQIKIYVKMEQVICSLNYQII